MTTEATPAADAAAATVDAATTAVDAVQAAAPVVAQHGNSAAEVFASVGPNVVYLMGFSFILGSLFTVLVLLLLDYMRRDKK